MESIEDLEFKMKLLASDIEVMRLLICIGICGVPGIFIVIGLAGALFACMISLLDIKWDQEIKLDEVFKILVSIYVSMQGIMLLLLLPAVGRLFYLRRQRQKIRKDIESAHEAMEQKTISEFQASLDEGVPNQGSEGPLEDETGKGDQEKPVDATFPNLSGQDVYPTDGTTTTLMTGF